MKNRTRVRSNEKQKVWEEHLLEWKSSGLTQAGYCRRHKLSIKSFGYWKRKLHPEQPSVSLVAVPGMHLSSVCSPSKGFELEVRGIYRIGIERGFDAQTLHALLEVLTR